MAGLAELAAVMMESAQQRVDVTAQNVSNMNTPAYLTRRAFGQILDLRDALPTNVVELAGASQPALKTTGNPLDIATDSAMVLMLRSDDGMVPARSAELHRNADGTLVDGQGRALQAAGGGDLTVGSGAIAIQQDGTVLVGGQAAGKIGLYHSEDSTEASPADGADAKHIGGARSAGNASRFAPSSPADGGTLHIGALIGSDVDLGAEMVELTKANRQAEAGARVFSVYDDLMGQALAKMGDMGR